MQPHNSPQITVWWCAIHHCLIWPKIANASFQLFGRSSHIKMMHCTITHTTDNCYPTSFFVAHISFGIFTLFHEYVKLATNQIFFDHFCLALITHSDSIQLTRQLSYKAVFIICGGVTSPTTKLMESSRKQGVLKNGIKGFQKQISRDSSDIKMP